MDNQLLKNIIEAALLAAGRPLSIKQLEELFPYRQRPDKAQLREALKALQENYDGRGIELIEVATGFRIQVRSSMIDWLTKLWEERAPRYSRALLETLALIAYRQPITRGDVENVRGVAVSTNIMRTLLERGWVKVVGHRDVPGKPALYGTTPQFLEYFGLKKLDELPPLAEISDVDDMVPELELTPPDENPGASLRVVVGRPQADTDESATSGSDQSAAAGDENEAAPAAHSTSGEATGEQGDADDSAGEGQDEQAQAADGLARTR